MLGRVLFCGFFCLLLSQASLARPETDLMQHSTSIGIRADNPACQDNINKIGNSFKDLVTENGKRALELVENIGSLFKCFAKENILNCAVNFFKAQADIIKNLLQKDLQYIKQIGSGVGGALSTCIGGNLKFTSNLAFNAQIF